MILLIFSFLPDTSLLHASTVCKHWNELGNDPTLWHSLYIRRIQLEKKAIAIESAKQNKNKKKSELERLQQVHELELETVLEEQLNTGKSISNHIFQFLRNRLERGILQQNT